MIPAQAVEAAAKAIFISTGQYGVEWDDLETYVKDRFRKDGTAALEAAAPHMQDRAAEDRLLAMAWNEGAMAALANPSARLVNPYRSAK